MPTGAPCLPRVPRPCAPHPPTRCSCCVPHVPVPPPPGVPRSPKKKQMTSERLQSSMLGATRASTRPMCCSRVSPGSRCDCCWPGAVRRGHPPWVAPTPGTPHRHPPPQPGGASTCTARGSRRPWVPRAPAPHGDVPAQGCPPAPREDPCPNVTPPHTPHPPQGLHSPWESLHPKVPLCPTGTPSPGRPRAHLPHGDPCTRRVPPHRRAHRPGTPAQR